MIGPRWGYILSTGVDRIDLPVTGAYCYIAPRYPHRRISGLIYCFRSGSSFGLSFIGNANYRAYVRPQTTPTEYITGSGPMLTFPCVLTIPDMHIAELFTTATGGGLAFVTYPLNLLDWPIYNYASNAIRNTGTPTGSVYSGCTVLYAPASSTGSTQLFEPCPGGDAYEAFTDQNIGMRVVVPSGFGLRVIGVTFGILEASGSPGPLRVSVSSGSTVIAQTGWIYRASGVTSYPSVYSGFTSELVLQSGQTYDFRLEVGSPHNSSNRYRVRLLQILNLPTSWRYRFLQGSTAMTDRTMPFFLMYLDPNQPFVS